MFAVSFRGISRMGSAFIFLRWFKLEHICIQVTSFYAGEGLNQSANFYVYFKPRYCVYSIMEIFWTENECDSTQNAVASTREANHSTSAGCYHCLFLLLEHFVPKSLYLGLKETVITYDTCELSTYDFHQMYTLDMHRFWETMI